ncbi:MAG TPA: O-antigen ligase family protein [Gaiellaceae bacterium]|nr:O-antigen ligase family protein [Gaiellaceae bacterium]
MATPRTDPSPARTPGQWRSLPLQVAGAASAVAAASIISGSFEPRASLLVLCTLIAGAATIVLSVTWPTLLFVSAFALLGVVLTEPAPVDLFFALLMVVTICGGKVKPQVPLAIRVLVGVTVIVSLLSVVNAGDGGRAAEYLFVSIYLLALAIWLTWAFGNAQATKYALGAYLAIGVCTSVAVVLALYAGLPGGTTLLFDPSRGKGLFQDPNVFAAFLVPVAAITLEEIGRPRLFGWKRRYAVLAFVATAAGSIVAFSRAGWLNLAIACTVVILVPAFRRGGLRPALRTFGALVLAGLVGFLLLSFTGSLTFLEERSQIESYDQQRFGAQSSAFRRMDDHVFGHGPGQVETSLDISTHSLYARAAFEQGAIGLVTVVFLLFATLYCAVAFVRADGSVHGVGSAALLGSWAGLMANSFFIDTIHWRHLYVVAALVWAGYASTRLAPARRL